MEIVNHLYMWSLLLPEFTTSASNNLREPQLYATIVECSIILSYSLPSSPSFAVQFSFGTYQIIYRFYHYTASFTFKTTHWLNKSKLPATELCVQTTQKNIIVSFLLLIQYAMKLSLLLSSSIIIHCIKQDWGSKTAFIFSPMSYLLDKVVSFMQALLEEWVATRTCSEKYPTQVPQVLEFSYLSLSVHECLT